MSVSPFTDCGMQLACHKRSGINRVLKLPHVISIHSAAFHERPERAFASLQKVTGSSTTLSKGDRPNDRMTGETS
jgi:hypothetical protein